MDRDAERNADQWAFTANLHRDSDKKRDPFTRADFLPASVDRREEIPTPDDLLAKVRALNAAFGGEDLTQTTQ